VGLIIFPRVATRDMKNVLSERRISSKHSLLVCTIFWKGLSAPNLVQAHVLVSCHGFHFCSFRQLGGSHSRGRHDRVGTSDPPRVRRRSTPVSWANADLNLTLAMALVFFACWIVWALQEVGPLGFLKELFAPKGESTGPMKVLMIVVFFAAGFCLEIVSILFRPVSLSFRLYGNIYAGENMLENHVPDDPRPWVALADSVYFMELLVGLVQARVFMLLCACSPC